MANMVKQTSHLHVDNLLSFYHFPVAMNELHSKTELDDHLENYQDKEDHEYLVEEEFPPEDHYQSYDSLFDLTFHLVDSNSGDHIDSRLTRKMMEVRLLDHESSISILYQKDEDADELIFERKIDVSNFFAIVSVDD